jgi:hypothetical protein
MRLKGIKCRLIKANNRQGTGLNITNHVIPPQKKKTGRGTGNHPFDFWVKTDEEAHKLVESRVEEEVAKYVDDNPEANANYVNQQKLGIRRKIRIEEWKKLPEEKQMAVVAAREDFSSTGNGEENR